MKLKELEEFVRKHKGSVFTIKDIQPGDIIVCYYDEYRLRPQELERIAKIVRDMNFNFDFLFVPNSLKFEIISVEE